LHPSGCDLCGDGQRGYSWHRLRRLQPPTEPPALSAAGGYQLESETNAQAAAWTTVTNEPIVSGGNYNVTNSAVLPTNQFYRLHMP
jgi:hypothetical protein